MTALPPSRWLGEIVEFTPADQTADGTVPRLDAAVAKPLVPSAEAQEIVFFPEASMPEDPPLRLFFETGADDIEQQVAGAAESAYVLGGKADLLGLADALRGTSLAVGGFLSKPVTAQGEPRYSGAEASPKRHRLLTLYPDAAGAVLTRARASTDELEPLAAKWAADFLLTQRDIAATEALRYIQSGDDERTGSAEKRAQTVARLLGDPPRGLEVSGPDATRLVGALRAVRAPRDALRTLDRASIMTQVTRRLATAVQLAALNPAYVAALPFVDVTTPDEDRVELDARVVIAAEIERIAVEHPIVHRLWTTPAVDLVVDAARRDTRASDDQLARWLSRDHAYRSAVGTALKNTFDACVGLRDELTSDHSAVWEYPRAVDGAMGGLGIARGSLAAAAAREQIATRAGEHETVAHINALVGLCQIVAMTGVVTAPVAAALEVVSLALSSAELGERAWIAWHQRRAARTHLNPGLGLAAEPSYAMVLLAVISTGFGAFGVRGALR
jgi:hypothetical protein